jgi:hypothetical protein
MVWLLPQPFPPLPSVSSTGDLQEDLERETTCRRKRSGGGEEPPYDGENAWSSVNHSIIGKLDGRHIGRRRKRDFFLTEERGGGGAKSYDSEKVSSFINHSILSGPYGTEPSFSLF